MSATLDQLMGSLNGTNYTCRIQFDDPKVCKSFLLNYCPYEILSSTRMDLGNCPKIHDLALRADFERAQSSKDYFYDLDLMAHLQFFVDECDCRTEATKQRLAETQEKLFAKVTTKVHSIHKLDKQIDKKLDQAKQPTSVERSTKLTEEVEELKKKKLEVEKEYLGLMSSNSHQQPKQRVCKVCSAYFGIPKNDRHVSYHLRGKLHLGFVKIREKLAKLETTAEKRQEDKRRTMRDGGFEKEEHCCVEKRCLEQCLGGGELDRCSKRHRSKWNEREDGCKNKNNAISSFSATRRCIAETNRKYDKTRVQLQVEDLVLQREYIEVLKLLKEGTYVRKEMFELLLDRGANVDFKGKDGLTPLHIAVESGSEEIVELLLCRGADVDVKGICGVTPLHTAVRRRYLQIVELLLQYRAYVNSTCTYRYVHGYTPLHLGCESGSEKIVQLLLSEGADVDAKGQDGITSLHIASQGGHFEIVENLIKHGACVNSKSASRFLQDYTPLHLAAEKGNEKIVQLLLSRDADVDANTNSGITPLHMATQGGYLQIVNHLLNYGAYPNSTYTHGFVKGYTPLHLAAEEGGEKIAELLLSRGSNVNAKGIDGRTPLHIACQGGHLEVVEHLLSHGALVNSTYTSKFTESFSPLHFAAEKGSEEIVTLLLSKKAYVDSNAKDNLTPLHVAIKKKHEKVVKLLLDHRANVDAEDKYGKTVLYFAVEAGHLPTVEQILNYCPNVNNKSNRSSLNAAVLNGNGKECGIIIENLLKYGFVFKSATVNATELLHAAIDKGYLKAVEHLLQYCVDINASDEYGRTALHFTAHLNQDQRSAKVFPKKGFDVTKGEIAKMLLRNGANVNAQTKDRITTLHAATKKGYLKVVEALLQYNADVNSKDKNGMTPLHIAAQEGYLEIVEVLLKFDASIDLKDQEGRTALYVASEQGKETIVSILLEYDSNFNIANSENLTPFQFAVSNVSSVYEEIYEIFYIRRNYSSRKTIIDMFTQHMVKTKSANLYVSKENLAFSCHYEISDFFNECQQEIENSKRQKVGNSNVSFHDILTKSISQLAIYARNESIVQILKPLDYATKFPIYAKMINSRFRKGIEKHEFEEQCNKSLYFLFNNLPKLPYNCTENILSYLRHGDMRVLMESCNLKCQ